MQGVGRNKKGPLNEHWFGRRSTAVNLDGRKSKVRYTFLDNFRSAPRITNFQQSSIQPTRETRWESLRKSAMQKPNIDLGDGLPRKSAFKEKTSFPPPPRVSTGQVRKSKIATGRPSGFLDQGPNRMSLTSRNTIMNRNQGYAPNPSFGAQQSSRRRKPVLDTADVELQEIKSKIPSFDKKSLDKKAEQIAEQDQDDMPFPSGMPDYYDPESDQPYDTLSEEADEEVGFTEHPMPAEKAFQGPVFRMLVVMLFSITGLAVSVVFNSEISNEKTAFGMLVTQFMIHIFYRYQFTFVIAAISKVSKKFFLLKFHLVSTKCQERPR